MLRFDNVILFSALLKFNLSVSLSIKTCGLDVLLFSEFINIVFVFYTLLNRFDYVVVYFFCDFLWLIQRINN